MTSPWPNPPSLPKPPRELAIGSALIGAARTVFPAAATPPDGDLHPTWCACRPCTDRLVAAVSRPLVPAPLVDPALVTAMAPARTWGWSA